MSDPSCEVRSRWVGSCGRWGGNGRQVEVEAKLECEKKVLAGGGDLRQGGCG